MQAFSETSEHRLGTHRVIGGEGSFVLFGEFCGAVEEMTWLQEIKQIPHVQQARLYRRTRTGDTQQAGIEAFQGMGNLGAGSFVCLRFVHDDNGPMGCHAGKGVLGVRDSFVVRQDDTVLA